MLKPVKYYAHTEGHGGIQIDSGVPIPALVRPVLSGRQKGPYRIAMESMTVGQSFFAKNSDFPSGKAEGVISSMVYNVTKQTGKRFVRRASADGLRVWRIA